MVLVTFEILSQVAMSHCLAFCRVNQAQMPHCLYPRPPEAVSKHHITTLGEVCSLHKASDTQDCICQVNCSCIVEVLQ